MTTTSESPTSEPAAPTATTWTGKLRDKWVNTLPPEKLLPETQPSYVASWIYVFGVATIAALVFIILSGLWLTFEGPAWYHTSSLGHFLNSVHFWSVQLFFIFMVVHPSTVQIETVIPLYMMPITVVIWTWSNIWSKMGHQTRFII